MEKDLISIVVPVYNVEKYLNDFFASLDCQTYSNYEVIFVDDGSKDNSGMMIDNYCKTHKNAKVIHKENNGAASARNEGIKLARGEYLMFFDSDDSFKPTTLETSIALIKKHNADVAGFSFLFTRERFKFNPSKYKKKIKLKKQKIYEGKDCIMANALARFAGWGYPWNKLYRHDLIKKCKFYPNIYHNDCQYFEDALFNYSILENATRVVFSKSRLYLYRVRKGGITKNSDINKKLTIFKNTEFINSLDKDTYKISQTYIKTASAFVDYFFLHNLKEIDSIDKGFVKSIYNDMKKKIKLFPGAKLVPFYFRIGMPFTILPMKIKLKIHKKI